MDLLNHEERSSLDLFKDFVDSIKEEIIGMVFLEKIENMFDEFIGVSI